MKTLVKYISLSALLTISCIQAQDKNKIIIDEKSDKPMLIGLCDRSSFSDSSFSWWFNSEYEAYEPDDSLLNIITSGINDYNITIIMGTWCSDSRREVPRFYKIIDSCGYNSDRIKLISVDRKKKDITGETEDLNIELVPTIIFFKNGEEKGRIEEAPEETLEKDIVEIMKK